LARWKSELFDHVPDLFEDGVSTADVRQEQLIEELFAQIGRLKVENDFLKKNLSSHMCGLPEGQPELDYDDAARLQRRSYPQLTCPEYSEPVVDYAWDPRGRRETLTDQPVGGRRRWCRIDTAALLGRCARSSSTRWKGVAKTGTAPMTRCEASWR